MNNCETERKVCDEMLPDIRETGSRSIPSEQEQSIASMPEEMFYKPTHCLVLHCRRYDGTVKHLFVHYNVNDAWFNETPVEMANVLSSASSRIATSDDSVAEYSYSWYRIVGDEYVKTPFVFCHNIK